MPVRTNGKKKIWLSHTGLEMRERCPRCFWLKYRKKINQPEGIVSRLANRFDGVIKAYFDQYRETGDMPPLIKEKITGRLERPFVEKYWYHHNDDYGYWGKLDECIIERGGTYTPVDHKTSSSDPREKETLPAYQSQLDSYAWLLAENKKKPSGKGYLIYFYPDHTPDLHDGARMVVHISELKTDPERAKQKFLRAIEALDGPLPASADDCPFCTWHGDIDAVLGSLAGEGTDKGTARESTIENRDTLF